MKESLEGRFSFWRFHHAFNFQHHSKSENGDHVKLWVTWKNVYIVPGALKKNSSQLTIFGQKASILCWNYQISKIR